MTEFPQGFFNLEYPAQKIPLSAGQHVLRGWLVAKAGEVLTDLRVRFDLKLWPAIYGFIRPDLAAHFKHSTSNLPAAFELPIFLRPGRHTLEFEALNISGQWQAVHSIDLEVCGTDVAPPAAPKEAVVNPKEFAELLRHLLRLQTAEPATDREQLTSRFVDQLGCPRYLRYPSLPFHGFFREPAIITRAAYGRLLVDGYLFHEQEKIKRVLATFDLRVWQVVDHGGVSPIAPQLYPQFSNAFRSNVKGYIEVPAQFPRPVTLRIYAELDDGSLNLSAVQRTFTYGLEEEKLPIAASPLLFLKTAVSLHDALTSRSIEVSTKVALRKQMWQTWRQLPRQTRHRVKSTAQVSESVPNANKPLGRVLVFTQNLDCGGAPLLLLEYCRHLISNNSAKLTLISAKEGPLLKEFRSAGAMVQIIDVSPLASANSVSQWRNELRRIADKIDFHSVQLIVANTLASYWAIHLARLNFKPSLFYIHESTTPPVFYHGTAAPSTIPFVEASFALATRVSFNTASTARYYKPFTSSQNYLLNPGWIDLRVIDAYQEKHPRELLRSSLGIKSEQKLVVNLGTICERKGQHVFAWAVDLFWHRYPELARGCDFRMVGGRDTPFDRWMLELVKNLGRSNLTIVPETDQPYSFLGAADVFVCSSYEESFPRVVLEAMAMKTPILSTDVHGIPSMIRHEKEALLVPPGDSFALAEGLARILTSTEQTSQLVTQARRRVVENFDSAIILPRQADLAHHTIAIKAARG